MISMNLVFHLFSALMAFVLAWFLIRIRTDLKFTREIIAGARSGQKTSKVYIDSPYRFLKRFTGMMGIGFDENSEAGTDGPLVKIDGSLLLKICLEYGVTSIRMKSSDKKQAILEFRALKADGKIGADKLAAVFGGNVQIEFNESAELNKTRS